MSKNISKLSGRIGLRDNLFDEISRSSLNSDNGKGIKDIKEIINNGIHIDIITGICSFFPSSSKKKLK